MNRRRLGMIASLALLVLAIIYAYVKYPRQASVDRLKYAPGAVAPGKNVAALDDRHVHLALLAERKGRVSGYRRNIFSPLFGNDKGVRRPPVPPPPLIPPPPPPAPVAPPPPPEVVAPPAVPVEMAKFTFLGFLVKDRKKTVFLSKDKDIVLVRKGDHIVGGKYEAVNITDEALTIKVVADGSEIVIPLVENRPLGTRR
jgi:hypothetical protein